LFILVCEFYRFKDYIFKISRPSTVVGRASSGF
jgi:hypothetical protein